MRWNPWQQTGHLFGHTPYLTAMKFAPGERELVTAGPHDIAIWDVESGRELRRAARTFSSIESPPFLVDAVDIYEWEFRWERATIPENWKPAVPEDVNQIPFPRTESLGDAAKRIGTILKIEIALSPTLDPRRKPIHSDNYVWKQGNSNEPLDLLAD